ncbi:A24 family peptidase [Aquibacillus sediminis]|uniref:A24 family peptidase n=1 Tax=Aquibacillus sediminis TaxID=2574734 RepID=UPI00110938C2|nr:prepilin peptidase [Aquibacillus sediminis]
MILTVLLFTVLLICIITDLKERKIYNKVIFPSLLLAIILHGIFYGFSGILFSLSGFGVGLAILLIPYLMGGMGAGDVKLLALIGAIKGTTFVVLTSVYMAMLGGVIGIVILVFNRRFLSRLKKFLFSIKRVRYGLKPDPLFDKNNLQAMFPYGVAITGGAVLAYIFHGTVLL